jgi:hypothetical protein
MISFKEAQTIVSSQLKSKWNSIGGTFHVADWGSENEKYWQIPVGAREFLVEGDLDFQIIDDQIYLIEKQSGEFTIIIGYQNLDLLETLKPYKKAPSFI